MRFSKKILSLLFCIITVVLFFSGCSSFEQGNIDDIIISETVSSNSSSFIASKLGSPDWIELYNPTDKEINIKDYQLIRSDSSDKSYSFPSCTIKPGSYQLVLAASASGDEDFDYPCTGFKLPKEGCELNLLNEKGHTLQKLKLPSLPTDISYSYYDGRYQFCLTPSPGSDNSGLFFDSLDEIYDQAAPEGLVLNEASRDFIEVYNSSHEPIQLAFFTVSEDAGDLGKYRFPYCLLKPGEFFSVSFGASGDNQAGLNVSKEEGYLYLSFNGEKYSMIDISGLWDNMSVGINENGETVYYADTTPGEKNSSIYSTSISVTDMPADAPVTITEVMLKNKNSLIDEDGDRSDWIELHNSSDTSVSLKNYYLSDDEEDILKWRLPDIELGANEYKIIFLSGKDRTDHTSFKVSNGEPVILTDYRALQKQTVMFPDESRLQNISYGIKDGKWLFFGMATPGKDNTTHGNETASNAERLDKSTVYINELSASFAPHSKGKDWIELYNPSEREIDLKNYYLSDDIENLTKYQLTGTISSGGYRVFEASKRISKQGAYTAPFSISQGGDTVFLSDGTGIIDYMDTGALKKDVTSGRIKGDFSGTRYFFNVPTKGSENSAPFEGALNAPTFSESGGIKKDAFTLEINGDGNIYYTTDGSTPTKDSALYTAPITIDSTSVISAFCTMDGHISSDPVSVTYLFVEEHSVPVVCLSASQSDLSSVYSVSKWSSNKSNNIERYCYVEYYEADGTLGTSFPAGFRVSGNSTRSYPQKSLNICLRGGYGQSSVVYPFFDNYDISEFKSLTLRNAGQNNDGSRLSDAYAGVLFSDLDIDTAQSRFVVLYINGRYWGLYDLKENLNEDAFASQHGEDTDTMNVIRRNTFAIAGNNTQIKEVLSYAQSWNLSDDARYEKFCEYVDADAWIDYIIARSYSGDGDMFNQKMWNTTDYSTKWRPIFYDCDFAFGGRGNTLCEFFTGEGFTTPDGSKTNMWIPTALKRNAGWREKFIKRYSQVMKYYPKYSLELYDKMVEEMKPEMKRHIAKWGTPSSYSSWERSVESQRKVIADRPKIIVRQIQDEFGVSSDRMRELFPDLY